MNEKENPEQRRFLGNDPSTSGSHARLSDESRSPETTSQFEDFKFSSRLIQYPVEEFEMKENETDKLGSGSYAEVCKYFHKDLKMVAIKRFPITGSFKNMAKIWKMVQREASVLCRFQHPNIVEVFGITKWPNAVGIIMEYVDGGNLYDLLSDHDPSNLNWRTRFEIGLSLISALSYIHNYRDNIVYCHGDVKPENILLTKSLQVKLADFGSADVRRATGATGTTTDIVPTKQHTLAYAAPEFLNDLTQQKHPSMDMYSFGMVLYGLICQKSPFSGVAVPSLLPAIIAAGMKPNIELINQTKVQLQAANDLSTFKMLRNLMKRCWDHEPTLRPSSKTVELEMNTHLNQQADSTTPVLKTVLQKQSDAAHKGSSSSDFIPEREDDVIPNIELHHNAISEEESKVIGKKGGHISVGGCQLLIPEGALRHDVQIKLRSFYERNDEIGFLTPLLHCEPAKLKFLKDATVILPTCIVTDLLVTAVIRRSENGIDWEDYQEVNHRNEKCFQFPIQGFTWFRVGWQTNIWPEAHIRKSLIYWTPSRLCRESITVVRCYIDDDIQGVKREIPSDENTVLEFSLLVRRGEENITFILSPEEEQSTGVAVLPATCRLNDCEKPHDQTSFKVRWSATADEVCTINILVQTTLSEVERKLDLARPSSDEMCSVCGTNYRSSHHSPHVVLQNFAIGKKICDGKFGAKICVCTRNDGIKFAAKIMSKNLYKNAGKEIKILKQLKQYDHLVSYFGCDDERSLEAIVVLELCGGDVDQFVKCIKDKEELRQPINQNTGEFMEVDFFKHFQITLMDIFRQTVKGLKFLHFRNIVHRDIKPANLLLYKNDDDQVVIKVSDFGLSREIPPNDSSYSTETAGTNSFIAPEYCVKEGEKIKPKTKADIFSLGLCFYFIFTKGHHVYGEESDEHRAKIRKGEAPIMVHLLPEYDHRERFVHPEGATRRSRGNENRTSSPLTATIAPTHNPDLVSESAQNHIRHEEVQRSAVATISASTSAQETQAERNHRETIPFRKVASRNVSVAETSTIDCTEDKDFVFDLSDEQRITACYLIRKMLKKWPGERPNITEVENHPTTWTSETKVKWIEEFSDCLKCKYPENQARLDDNVAKYFEKYDKALIMDEEHEKTRATKAGRAHRAFGWELFDMPGDYVCEGLKILQKEWVDLRHLQRHIRNISDHPFDYKFKSGVERVQAMKDLGMEPGKKDFDTLWNKFFHLFPQHLINSYIFSEEYCSLDKLVQSNNHLGSPSLILSKRKKQPSASNHRSKRKKQL